MVRPGWERRGGKDRASSASIAALVRNSQRVSAAWWVAAGQPDIARMMRDHDHLHSGHHGGYLLASVT